MDFDAALIVDSLPRLLGGALLSVELVALSVAAGLLIAGPVAMMRASANPLLRALPWPYVFFFRGTPLLVQIFLIYYGLGQFEAVRESWAWTLLREAYWCAVIAFTLNTAAYSAEILRGGIQAVPRGEIEAARAIGMSRLQVYRRVVLPRAFRIALPAYGNEIVFMIKGSALASTITLMDLTGVARTLVARTYKPVEVFLAAGLLYLVIVYGVTWLLRRLERRLSVAPAAPPPPQPSGGS
jgi:polar amino acid transport system permease protein